MKYLIGIAFCLASLSLSAQYDIEDVEKDSVQKEKKVNPFNIKQRTYVGGELSVRFGSVTYLYLAPMVGYDILKDKGLSAGVSGMYQLYRIRYSTGGVASTHSYGGGIFVRYRPFRSLLFQVEGDLYNTEDFYGTTYNRVNIPAFMGGVGYAGGLGDRAYYQFLLMYDFIDDINMPLVPIAAQLPLYLRFGFVFYLG